MSGDGGVDASGDGNACPQSAPGDNLGWGAGDVAWESSGAITGHRFALSFDGSSEPHMVKSYLLDGTEVLDEATGCTDPSRLGLLTAPGGNQHTGVGTGMLQNLISGGDGFTQVRSTWSASFPCLVPAFVTDWFAFPDGRMVRRDRLTSASQPAGSCACTSAVPHAAETGLFQRNAFTTLVDRVGPVSLAAASMVSPPLCFSGTALGLAVIVPPGSATTASSLVGEVGFAATFTSGSTLAPGAEGWLALVPVPAQACATATAALAPFATGFALEIDGAQRETVSPDGVAGGIDVGYPVVSTTTVLAVPHGAAAPPGFAFALHCPTKRARSRCGATACRSVAMPRGRSSSTTWS